MTVSAGGGNASLTVVANERLSVVVADDHSMIHEMVAQLLGPEFDIVATARDGQELIDAVRAHEPDLAIVDLSMPRVSGIEAVRILADSGCKTIMIILTVDADPRVASAALDAGARGYVLKSRASTDLVHSIRQAQAGKRFVYPM